MTQLSDIEPLDPPKWRVYIPLGWLFRFVWRRLFPSLVGVCFLASFAHAIFDVGVNYTNNTTGCTPTPSNTTFWTGPGGSASDSYSTTRDGYTFGWTNLSGKTDIVRGGSIYPSDCRLDGYVFTSNDGASVLTGRINGFSAGSATVHMAAGYVYGSTRNYVRIYDSDGTTLLWSSTSTALSSDQIIDAAGNVTTMANWSAGETASAPITISGDHIFVQVGSLTNIGDGSETKLVHLRVVQSGGGTTTTTTTNSTTTTVSTTTTTLPSNPEIPCDGIDNDGSGGDLNCPGPDQDGDGYTTNGVDRGFGTGVDCDDLDRTIYPGWSGEYTTSGCSAGQTRKCQPSGSFTSCSATPVDQSTGNGHSYYIDPTSGSDSNPGTKASPWQTLDMVCDWSSGAPGGHHQLVAGDVVYLVGTAAITHTYTPGYSAGMSTTMFCTVATAGDSSNPITIMGYPGSAIQFDGNTGSAGFGVHGSVSGGSATYVRFGNFEITDGGTNQFWLYGSNSSVERVYCHDNVSGDGNSNAACLKVDASGSQIHHNRIADSWGSSGNQENQGLIVLLSNATSFDIFSNVFYYTAEVDNGICSNGNCHHGAGVWQKHASITAGAKRVWWNKFLNIGGNSTPGAIRVSAPDFSIKHNLIVESTRGVKVGDFGGAPGPYLDDLVIDNNTFINTEPLATGYYLTADTNGTAGPLSFQNNVVTAESSSYCAQCGLLELDPYGGDVLNYYGESTGSFQDLVTGGKLTIDNNCYYNPNAAVQMCLWCDNSVGQTPVRSASGASYNFTNWKAAGYDTSSFNETPTTDQYFRSTATHCNTKGWLTTADESEVAPTTTTLTTTTTTTSTTTTTLPTSTGTSSGAGSFWHLLFHGEG